MRAKLLTGLALSIIFIAQSALAARLEIQSVHSDPAGGVSVVINVSEETPLKTEDLRLLEDDMLTVAASKVEPFQNSDWKFLLVLCIDTSGSMAKVPLDETKRALKAILGNNLFRAKDRIALIAFENRPRILHFFDQPAKIHEKVDELAWLKGTKTVLYQALYESLDHFENLKPVPPESRHILIISDGKDEGSTETLKDVREKAIDLDIPIHVVTHVRKDRVKEDLREGYVQQLNALAVQTGGRFQHAEPGRVHDALAQVLQEVMVTPVVYFERKINDTGLKTKTIGVKLHLADGSSVKDTIPMEILSTAIEIPPTAHSSKFGPFWMVFTGLLLLAFIVLVFRSMKKPAQKQVKQAPYIEPQEVDKIESRKVSPRLTHVGGYNFPVPNDQNPVAILIGVDGPVEGQQFPVEKELFYIGADEENDLSIPEDDYISGKHAFLQYEHGKLLIFDRGSQNGTFVNEEPVTDEGISLNLGDRIRLGNSSFDLESELR
jgi:hypothetical protein